MAHRRRRAEYRGRKISPVRAYGKYFGLGPELDDEITGFKFPKAWMVKQCGRWISRDPNDGSYDECYDERYCCLTPTNAGTLPVSTAVPASVTLPAPLCLYHFDTPTGFLTDSGSKGFHLSLEVLEEG